MSLRRNSPPPTPPHLQLYVLTIILVNKSNFKLKLFFWIHFLLQRPKVDNYKLSVTNNWAQQPSVISWSTLTSLVKTIFNYIKPRIWTSSINFSIHPSWFSWRLGKNMVRWFTFDILKSPYLTLATILIFKIIIKLYIL
jgi:hypothetical protein